MALKDRTPSKPVQGQLASNGLLDDAPNEPEGRATSSLPLDHIEKLAYLRYGFALDLQSTAEENDVQQRGSMDWNEVMYRMNVDPSYLPSSYVSDLSKRAMAVLIDNIHGDSGRLSSVPACITNLKRSNSRFVGGLLGQIFSVVTLQHKERVFA